MNATIVPAESVKLATGMLDRGEIDLYATNKPTLFEMSDAMPNARILEPLFRTPILRQRPERSLPVLAACRLCARCAKS